MRDEHTLNKIKDLIWHYLSLLLELLEICSSEPLLLEDMFQFFGSILAHLKNLSHKSIIFFFSSVFLRSDLANRTSTPDLYLQVGKIISLELEMLVLRSKWPETFLSKELMRLQLS